MEKINKEYDKLQNKYGSKELNSVYGYGKKDGSRAALVFMNPTKRNIATSKSWQGLKAQWLGTKQIWDFLSACGVFSAEINKEIKSKRPKDWDETFCEKVYDEVIKQGLWITNLAKCTQDDARALPDEVFLQYTDLLKEELKIVNPQKIFFFGNQVSSIMLERPISVSKVRHERFELIIGGQSYDCYAVYYPVGNGRFNQSKAVEDIKSILDA